MHTASASQNGFSLTELLIVLAIMGSLLVAGAPTLSSLLDHVKTANAEVLLASNLQHARNAAITHNRRTLVCPSDNGQRCRAGGDWQHGWIIAQDADHDGQPDAGVPLLGVQAPLAPGTRIISSAHRSHVTFQPTGSAGGSNVRFTICRAHGTGGRAVVVANSGRVRTDTPDAAHLQQCIAGLR